MPQQDTLGDTTGPAESRRVLVRITAVCLTFGTLQILIRLLERLRFISEIVEDSIETAILVACVVACVHLFGATLRRPQFRWFFLASVACLAFDQTLDITGDFESIAKVPILGKSSTLHNTVRDLLALMIFGSLLTVIYGLLTELSRSRREKTDRTLERITELTTPLTGQDFLAAFVEQLAQTLGVQYVFLAVRNDSDTIRTLAFWSTGQLAQNIECSVVGGPCEVTINSAKPVHFPSKLRDEFPGSPVLEQLGAESYYGVPLAKPNGRSLGHLCIMDTKPMALPPTSLPAFQILVERARAELQRQANLEQVAKSESWFRSIFNAGPHGRLVLDTHGHVQSTNTRLYEILNLEDSVALDDIDFFSLVHPDERATFRKLFEGALEGTEGSLRHQLIVKDGPARWLNSRLAPLSNGDGAIAAVLVSTRAIDTEIRAEADRAALVERIQKTQKFEALGVLSGRIAHDFNNLLTGVMGYSDLALQSLDPQSENAANIHKIETVAHQAARRCDQLIAYSGKGRFVLEPSDLNATIEEMSDLLRTISSRATQLNLELSENLPAVGAAPSQLNQVVLNLITNAAEAMGSRDGTLCVRTGDLHADEAYLSANFAREELQPGHYVYLEVSDTGPGMATATIERIFEPFYTTKISGRGLGLAAVRGIVSSHGGGLKVSSQLELGTTFRAMFPASKNRAASPQPVPSSQRPPRNRLERSSSTTTNRASATSSERASSMRDSRS